LVVFVTLLVPVAVAGFLGGAAGILLIIALFAGVLVKGLLKVPVVGLKVVAA
jgi:hypothetical protein